MLESLKKFLDTNTNSYYKGLVLSNISERNSNQIKDVIDEEDVIYLIDLLERYNEGGTEVRTFLKI